MQPQLPLAEVDIAVEWLINEMQHPNPNLAQWEETLQTVWERLTEYLKDESMGDECMRRLIVLCALTIEYLHRFPDRYKELRPQTAHLWTFLNFIPFYDLVSAALGAVTFAYLMQAICIEIGAPLNAQQVGCLKELVKLCLLPCLRPADPSTLS